MLDQNHPSTQASIHCARNHYESKFQQAKSSVQIQEHALTENTQAVVGDRSTGCVSGTLRSFLNEPELPFNYKMKAYLALSGDDEENELWENRITCLHFLKEAEQALQDAKQLYVKEEIDIKVLEGFEHIIEVAVEGIANSRS